MLTGLFNNKIINCYDDSYNKDYLKKLTKDKKILCPVCKKPYEYCHGEITSPYFRHMDKNRCKVKYSELETEEHIQGKKDLHEWIKKQDGVSNVILEAWIPETRQRPDIMFDYNNKKYVIEYQCSPIASEYIERHKLYESINVHDIWICGTEKYISANKRLNTLENECKLYYDFKTKALYYMEDMGQKQFHYLSKLEDYRYDIRQHRAKKYIINKYKNRKFHLMENFYDYTLGYSNYVHIKDNSNSYKCIGSYYPSPTGRASRKYPYPIRKYEYSSNHSYARFLKLSNTKLNLK